KVRLYATYMSTGSSRWAARTWARAAARSGFSMRSETNWSARSTMRVTPGTASAVTPEPRTKANRPLRRTAVARRLTNPASLATSSPLRSVALLPEPGVQGGVGRDQLATFQLGFELARAPAKVPDEHACRREPERVRLVDRRRHGAQTGPYRPEAG